MVFGAFDGLHPGHLKFFESAKKHGDFLIVSVGRDLNVEKIKGKAPLFSQEERLALIRNLKIVDKVILGDSDPNNFFDHIQKEAPDIICLGYDQWASQEYVKKELGKVGLTSTKVVRLSAFKPGQFKSTQMKKDLSFP